MSPPDTNIEKQKRRHWAPLWGIGLALVFALGLFVWWITYVVDEGNEPEGADVQIDGATGEPVNESSGIAEPPQQ
jgi:hypothetical protein